MRVLFIILTFIVVISCGKVAEPDEKQTAEKVQPQYFYKDLLKDKTLTKDEYFNFRKALNQEFYDSLGKTEVKFHLYDKYNVGDSIIQEFKYTVKQGHTYVYNGSNALLYQIIGEPFPKKQLATRQGEDITLGMDHKPAMINFWFTQCAPCVREIPVLNSLKEAYNEKVNFIAITFSKKAEVEKFMDKHPFEFIQVTDASSFIDSLGVKDYPTSIFIDKEGKLQFVERVVEGKGEEFKMLLDQLIK